MPFTASLSDRSRRWLIHNDENPFCTLAMRASLVKGLLRFLGRDVMLCRAVRFRRLYRTLGLWHLLRRSVGMRYLALVTDYDGTIATKGRVSAIALQTMARL